jgi:glutamate 5-kinase
MGRQSEKNKTAAMPYQRIVVKLGTRLLTGGGRHLNLEVMAGLVTQVARLRERGVDEVLVSSGAIASGRQRLGLAKAVKGVPHKQVLAAVGQGRLMNVYEQLFGWFNITVAQALLTRADLANRAGYLNARNTLLALMDLGVIAVVNENDVVSIDEIKEAKFGDNDNLSAMVANLVDADLLMILTDIDGLYTADPARDDRAKLIPRVDRIDASVLKMAAAASGDLGTGGMVTKIEAARLATSSGVSVVIANGREPDVILRLAAGEAIGTHFPPVTGNLESRERWMVSGLCTRGKLVIDPGAAVALKQQKRSLLAAGIQKAEGRFSRGDIVSIFDNEGNQLGCGITNYGSSDIGIIKGSRSNKIAGLLSFDYGPEVVHRNNLALLERGDMHGRRQTATIS